MAAAFALGVFNDNFFKQAALLLAVAARQSYLQGVATAIFSLPFLIFAAPAGWMADRFPKRTIVIVAKFLELAAMLCGAVGVCTGNFTLVLLMLAVMGLQATIFSPALNGAIAEIYPAKQVLKANAILRTVVTANILLGVVLAGFALAAQGGSIHGIERGKALVAAAVVAVSLLGILASLGVPRLPAASPGVRFPWTGPLDTARELYRVRKDALLAITLIADTFVWFGGSVQVLLINKLGMDQFHLERSPHEQAGCGGAGRVRNRRRDQQQGGVRRPLAAGAPAVGASDGCVHACDGLDPEPARGPAVDSPVRHSRPHRRSGRHDHGSL